MATDTPFGLSFGNPSKYMGQNPGLAEAGKAVKIGLAIGGLKAIGAIDALDKLGIKQNQSGGFSYNNPSSPTGSVPPVAPTAAAMAPVAPSTTNSPVMPSNAVAQPLDPNAVAPAAPTPLMPSPTIGADILDGKFHGVEHSYVDPQAQRDSLVLPQQVGYNPILQTGNEYQQVPGYGKLAKAFQAFAGGMG